MMETSDFSKPLIIYINDINDRHSEFLNNDEIWRYWFEEEGTIIFSYFLFAQFWNVGDIINVSFAFDLYDNGVLKKAIEKTAYLNYLINNMAWIFLIILLLIKGIF